MTEVKKEDIVRAVAALRCSVRIARDGGEDDLLQHLNGGEICVIIREPPHESRRAEDRMVTTVSARVTAITTVIERIYERDSFEDPPHIEDNVTITFTLAPTALPSQPVVLHAVAFCVDVHPVTMFPGKWVAMTSNGMREAHMISISRP